MDDAVKKKKYANISYRLYLITNQINNLNQSVQQLENTMNRTILINDKTYNGDAINNIKKSLSSSATSISNSRYSTLRKSY